MQKTRSLGFGICALAVAGSLAACLGSAPGLLAPSNDAGDKGDASDLEGGPKLVNVTFHITEGPKVRIREIERSEAEAKDRAAAERRSAMEGIANDFERSVIREQVELGVAVRMAVLEILAANNAAYNSAANGGAK